MAITKKRIYKSVAKEMIARDEKSADAIIQAVTSYIIALKKEGCIVELWSAETAIREVRKHMKDLKPA
jgi:hypothetical protein